MTVPQTQPLNERQVENNAGGFVYALDPFKQLERFLILGSEGATYYATEKSQTYDNIKCVEKCLGLDPLRTIQLITTVSQSGRAPKNEPALFALAKAASYAGADANGIPAENVRSHAYTVLPSVARTGTHLLHFVGYCVPNLKGWSRGLRSATSRWLTAQNPDDLVYQLLKYQSRDGWSMRDLLRTAHPKPVTLEQSDIFRWVLTGDQAEFRTGSAATGRLQAVAALKAVTNAPTQAVEVIRNYRLPREIIPTELLNEAVIWESLLPDMGITALIRNLPTLTRVGVLDHSAHLQAVIGRLTSAEQLRKGRVHPIQLLIAQLTYAAGKSLRGSSTWAPKHQITGALNQAFYLAFKAVEPTNKRILVAVDVSGSMGAGNVNGIPGLSPCIAAGAMALATLNIEPNVDVVAFTKKLQPLRISPSQRLDDVVKVMQESDFGDTDCALPMIYGLERFRKTGTTYDAFIVYTDNETWYGYTHPTEALKNYRKATNIDAKLIVQAFTATNFSIADPLDGGMLDVVGLDSAAPSVVADFIRG
jgi:60 kDa SS-A/Ro ribonucleoprotein